MTFVAKISKEGYDVRNTDDVNLLYSAELASHSIFNIISASILIGQSSVTIDHGLDFTPKVWVYMVGSDGDGTFMRRIPYLDDNNYKVDYYLNDSSIVLVTDGNQGSRLDFKIIIFTRSPQP